MHNSSDKWFRYLKENIRIDEGVRDLGLTEMITDFIESALHDAPEGAKTWMGHRWKKTHLHQYMPRIQMQRLRFETMEPLLSALDYWTGGTKKDDLDSAKRTNTDHPTDVNQALQGLGLDEPTPDVQFESILKENIQWSAEKAKRTKFILQNINRTIKDDALGKWPRAFKKAVKALGKLGLKSDVVEFVQEVLQNTEDRAWKAFETRFREVFTFLNMHPDNIRIISDIDNMVDADTKAEAEIAEMEDPDQIVHTFDDGSYWYDLDTSSCDLEGERMGHCGAGQSGGTLFSLRKPEGKRGKSKSFVTLERGDGEQGETLFQIKGRGNSAPPEATWDHIAWFIDNMSIQAVEEQGEYSDEPEDFSIMNDYLESQTSANFSGNRQTRVDELESELDNEEYNFEFTHSSLSYEISDYGEENNQIYVEVYCECEMEIDLGWPMFFETKGGYIAMDKNGNPITGFQMIPTTYSQQSDFVNDVGIDYVMNALPGEEVDVELSFRMQEGTAEGTRSDEEEGYEAQETAHLIVTMRKQETFEDEQRAGGGSAASEYQYFGNEVENEFDEEDKYAEHIRYVMSRLQEEEYMKQNAYVKDMENLSNINDLKHWSVHVDSGEAKFTFLDEKGDGTVDKRLPTGLAVPTETMIYLTAGERESPETLIGRMFSLGRATAREVRAPSLNSQMAQRLNDAYGAAQRAKMAATGQETFDFGDKYEPKSVMELAKDIELVIYPKIRYDAKEPNRVPTLSFDFFFQIRANFDDDVEEIDRVMAMTKHINENPAIVREAVRDIILTPMSKLKDSAWARKSRMLNPNTAVSYYNEMNSKFGARADAGNDDDERRMLIAMWIRDNYAQMDDLEKSVAYNKYIGPMLGLDGAVFRIFGANAAINPETGEPRAWYDLVQKERERRGVGLASSEAPVNESIEDQISRIDALLNERRPIDLRIYKVDIGCKVDTAIAGNDKQIEDQIRGIQDVTTVRHLAEFQKPLSPSSVYRVYQIKFERYGQETRDEFRDLKLIPAINSKQVTGVSTFGHIGQVTSVDNPLREEWGGLGYAAGMAPEPGPKMPTPAVGMEDLIQDWSEGGVKVYDTPMNTNQMQYHVMMDVDDLWNYCSRYYRGSKTDFDGRYRHFIARGAQMPVYIALGQNGRAKITGNEDLIWFAKQAGEDQVPVFFSYQKQV